MSQINNLMSWTAFLISISQSFFNHLNVLISITPQSFSISMAKMFQQNVHTFLALWIPIFEYYFCCCYTVEYQNLARVNRIWPTAVAGEADKDLMLSALAFLLGGTNSVPNSVTSSTVNICVPFPQMVCPSGNQYLEWQIRDFKITPQNELVSQ